MKRQKPFLNGLIIILIFSIVIVSVVVYMQRSDSTDQSGPAEEPQTDQENGTDPQDTLKEKPELPMWYLDGDFELPIVGAAGYTSVSQNLYADPGNGDTVIEELKPGTPFEIRGESGNYWHVRSAAFEGWIEHRFAFINLPDVIPSILYDHTNSYESRFQTSFMEIPELTGEALNPMIGENKRLNKNEFIMPLLYQSAKKVFHAQQIALQNGESLVMYETFRPREVQLLVNEELTKLSEENEEVAEGLTTEPWSMTWFINMNISNHQRGLAVDVSLAAVDDLTDQTIGDYKALKVESYSEYDMHTPLHELSAKSAIFERPIASRDREGWKELVINPEMTEPSIRLQEYMVEAGFNPLASEWWHFNDIDALEDLNKEAGSGEFQITETLNSEPLWEDVSATQE